MKNAYKNLIGKPEGMRLLGTCEDTFKVDVKEIG
jgi:hypothetical protein